MTNPTNAFVQRRDNSTDTWLQPRSKQSIRHSVYVIKCGHIKSHLHKQNPEWIMQLSEMSDLSE